MKKIIYIFSDGELKRQDNTLRFLCEETNRFLPIEDISDIFVFGEVSLNKKLLELLSQREIVLHYFNYHGYYMGTFYPREHYNSGYMILKQAATYEHEARRLELARLIVAGAIRNMRQVLKYYENRGKGLLSLVEALERYEAAVASCAGIPELMGLEGNARDTYYAAFDTIIDVDGFVFGKRTRRPPENRLNCLISFGNSMMYALALSEIYKTHLDPRIGFLHAASSRRFSLNLDVAEIFKPLIVDRLIFSLIHKGMIKTSDFLTELNGIVMKDKARKAFVEALDEKLKTTITHRELKRNVSYRRLIRLELYKIQKHLMGEKQYIPFVARW